MWDTKVTKVEEGRLEATVFDEAAALLRGGQIVAFPTETVYGLGAWAMSEEGITRIYEAKGRPADNPLIVHIWPGATLEGLISEIPACAEALMERFWPGPLTLIFPKGPLISKAITGGLDTVAIRMPSHPVAKSLLEACRLPVVAPSANTSGRPSPTTAQHVKEDMAGRIPLILDGGPCAIGLESTVLDVTSDKPMILRPGAVTREMLQQVIGDVRMDPGIALKSSAVPKAPGMKYKHYAPKGELILLEGPLERVRAMMEEKVAESIGKGYKAGLLITAEMQAQYFQGHIPAAVQVEILGSRKQPDQIAANLFRALRRFDEGGCQAIYGEALPRDGVGEAVMNRLCKAAAGRILHVDTATGKDEEE